ncbi:Hus1-like family protein [Leishmania donovani]|uniref:tryptophan--tRNA ligase n=2 Tax=Leishmania donovani TaxID=5661 RepID=A0A504XRJ8_LEIDO|nr:Hus1-like family protein [Leishmania donovani]
MRFKATLKDAKGLLGVLQVCRSIQRDCIVRLQSERIRFFSNTNAADGVQVWMRCQSSFLFSDMVCDSGYDEHSITCEVLDLAQLIHIVKQAEARERSHQGTTSRVQMRLARNGRYPLWRVAMQGLSGQPDVSFDVPLRILGDREIQSLSPPPLEKQHLQILVPDMLELTTFIDKLKNTAADSVTFSARVLMPPTPRRGAEDGEAEDADGGAEVRRGVKRPRVKDTLPLASLLIYAEHFMARFSLKYEAVELTRKFARFFSAVKELDPMKMSMYLVDPLRNAIAYSGRASDPSEPVQHPRDGDAGAEDVITPWVVTAKGPQGINYDRVLTTFKAERMDDGARQHMHDVMAKRRKRAMATTPSANAEGVATPDLTVVPSGDATPQAAATGAMHLGHVLPFMLTKYLQDVFNLPLVIQITDDEKFLFRDVPFEGAKADELIRSNIKDIIAFDFNPRHTFIFRNTHYMGDMYPTVLRLQRCMTGNAVKHTLGITDSDNVGKLAFPATQAAPCFSTAFRRVLQNGDRPMRCLIPCAIDQDPFFVLTRAAALRLKQLPPALLHTKFLPALKGLEHKMSSSAEEKGVITLHDTDKQVRKKLRRAFSGGCATLEQMQEAGAILEVDVAYQYLRFFCPDDTLFADVTQRYRSGALNSGEVKDLAADCIIREVLHDWRKRRATVTDDDVVEFCSIRNILL